MRIAGLVGLLTSAQLGDATALGEAVGGFLSGTQEQDSLAGQNPFVVTAYGKSKCPCIGIDQIKGYYATNLDYYHIQYTLDTGSSCGAWDLETHPLCEGGAGPEWCFQSWCYIDPCNCETETLPGLTQTGVEFQGNPAYWSYETCGMLDLYSKEMSPDACISQKNDTACGKLDKCAWDGHRCGGKELVQGCKEADTTWHKHDGAFGQEDCRCIGLSGREIGTAYLNINDEERIRYAADVGAYCNAWEAESHPDCTMEGEKPSWCLSKWCFVDPCKCKTSSPPRIVMPANQALKFQGKTAYWSSETCGNHDEWTVSHGTEYCVTQKSEPSCAKFKNRCAWTGKDCVGKALAGICQEQEGTGILGFEQSSAMGLLAPLSALLPAMLVVCVLA